MKFPQLRDPQSLGGIIVLTVVALVVLSLLFSPQEAVAMVAVAALAAYVVRRARRRGR